MCFYNFPGRIVPWSNYRCEPCWHCQVCTLHLWSRGQMRGSMLCTIRLSSSHKIGLKADQTLSGEEERQAKTGHILSSIELTHVTFVQCYRFLVLLIITLLAGEMLDEKHIWDRIAFGDPLKILLNANGILDPRSRQFFLSSKQTNKRQFFLLPGFRDWMEEKFAVGMLYICQYLAAACDDDNAGMPR